MNERDARLLQRHIRAGVVTLQSMHIVVSREHTPILARSMSIAMHTGRSIALQHLVPGRRCLFVLARAIEMECLRWQPARGAAHEVTYQTLHYHYDAWQPLAEWLERGFSSITSDYKLNFPVRCFTERPLKNAATMPVENDATMPEMEALAKFVGRHFTRDGKVNHAVAPP